jgi:hypothetical protein
MIALKHSISQNILETWVKLRILKNGWLSI